MKKIFLLTFIFLLSIHAMGQIKVYKPIAQTSFSKSTNSGDMGSGSVAIQFIKNWPKDDNGKECTLIRVKFYNMASSESNNIRVNEIGGDVTEKWNPLENQNTTPDEMWLFVSPGQKKSLKFSHDRFGVCKTDPMTFTKKTEYTVVLTLGGTASVTFTSLPEGADIFVDGGYVGKTRMNVEHLTYGKHIVKMTHGAETQTATIEVSSHPEPVFIDLRTRVHSTIKSDPKGAKITMFDEIQDKEIDLGTAPINNVELPLGAKLYADLNGKRDTIEVRNAPELVLKPVKKKDVHIFAKYDGQKVSGATCDIDGIRMEQLTPVDTRLSFEGHNVTVSYNGQSKSKRIRVNKSTDEYTITIPVKNHFVWPWERDFNTLPFGFSVGYVSKQWVKTSGTIKVKGNIWGKENQSLSGIQAGIRIMPSLGLGICVDTGLYYEYYFSTNDDVDGSEYYNKYEEHSIYVPAHLSYRFAFSENVAFFVAGGFGFDCGIKNMLKTTEDDSNQLNNVYGESGFPNRLNLSADIGFGFQVKSIYLHGQFSRGLTNHSHMVEGIEGARARQNKLSISLSWLFNN